MTVPGAIGKKHGMTQIFNEEGDIIPVSVIELLPLVVTQVKTKETDGYAAIQVGYQEGKEKHVNKPEQGHLKKNKLPLFRHLKEFRVEESEISKFQVGQEVQPEFLQSIGTVNVTGKTIGKGFQGTIKLHHFARGPMSHGSKSHRIPGSIGAGTTPGRVFKGVKMAGNMGNRQRTVENLRVVRVDLAKHVLLVEGTIPGKPGNIVIVSPRKVVGAKK